MMHNKWCTFYDQIYGCGRCYENNPQGSHLVPLLLNVFINDFRTIYSNILLFAYDTKLPISYYITPLLDTKLLQHDLDSINNIGIIQTSCTRTFQIVKLLLNTFCRKLY